MSKVFQFKQFNVEQDRCAMKIGTDGVLLGAWASLDQHPESILDIGAGTGVIALMLAQRSTAELIDALEIEENAYEQCVDNFENSDWGDRLFCYHAALDEFAEEMEGETYDLIISNPPFYDENFTSTEENRNLARFTEALPFEDLVKYSAQLLAEKGRFCTIIPYKNEEEFIQLASEVNLYPQKITRVRGNENSPLKRSLLQFGFEKTLIKTSELIIEIDRHVYTEDYKNLVKDFYLKM
ncbi:MULTISPECIES: tRNA1(Val) (adenine(37)-N6)-methyltransferase [Mesonia]|uniref:tRNA1(Val) (Adenine(37)-N6)-methyltransferase n=1 Tax=Mesonia oceanica TaxID=2687242 RepID=A0AC61Y662_9FLAO|nr:MULTISPECIES: methyltransferase [Mesonia]MAN29003.1 tRNA (adenine-N(6)-)-methyltransferase [Mesonia sp.]MAQ42783.1 tRNA (adenine-N(6)-)-methyltransferase [Mesonia sp.]MBJ99321.1 tRNA (adenine-N(6)-)-methyltransferase [Flavobacteriaceae bacterium]VVU99679.1 tRNA1(Val) (adenine(37)-N6)-methyltransferase [Mesonia oceanica]|tara:strand:- start:31072 stop:31788 length:717 start_codon:yes stop_codon:yes gene_type:complete